MLAKSGGRHWSIGMTNAPLIVVPAFQSHRVVSQDRRLLFCGLDPDLDVVPRLGGNGQNLLKKLPVVAVGGATNLTRSDRPMHVL